MQCALNALYFHTFGLILSQKLTFYDIIYRTCCQLMLLEPISVLTALSEKNKPEILSLGTNLIKMRKEKEEW